MRRLRTVETNAEKTSSWHERVPQAVQKAMEARIDERNVE